MSIKTIGWQAFNAACPVIGASVGLKTASLLNQEVNDLTCLTFFGATAACGVLTAYAPGRGVRQYLDGMSVHVVAALIGGGFQDFHFSPYVVCAVASIATQIFLRELVLHPQALAQAVPIQSIKTIGWEVFKVACPFIGASVGASVGLKTASLLNQVVNDLTRLTFFEATAACGVITGYVSAKWEHQHFAKVAVYVVAGLIGGGFQDFHFSPYVVCAVSSIATQIFLRELVFFPVNLLEANYRAMEILTVMAVGVVHQGTAQKMIDIMNKDMKTRSYFSKLRDQMSIKAISWQVFNAACPVIGASVGLKTASLISQKVSSLTCLPFLGASAVFGVITGYAPGERAHQYFTGVAVHAVAALIGGRFQDFYFSPYVVCAVASIATQIFLRELVLLSPALAQAVPNSSDAQHH